VFLVPSREAAARERCLHFGLLPSSSEKLSQKILRNMEVRFGSPWLARDLHLCWILRHGNPNSTPGSPQAAGGEVGIRGVHFGVT
jgi:hypothetical protein